MKKLSLFAVSVGGALVCAAVPASFDWSSAKFSLDTAEARVGRPLTATSVAGVNRRVHRRAYRRAAAGAAVGAAAVGAAAGAAYVGGPAPAYAPPAYVGGPAPAYAPDLRLPQHPLMAGRVMATAQGLTRILRSSILPREGGAEPNRTVINFAGRHRFHISASRLRS